MKTLVTEMQKIIESGEAAVLCIVTHTEGSTPRKAGAKMLVRTDGSIVGTIGGGNIELQVIKKAVSLCNSLIPVTERFELFDDLSMHCGGKMDVYMEAISNLQKVYIFGAGHVGRAVARLATQFGFLVTLIDERPGIFSTVNFPEIQCLEKNYFKAIEDLAFNESVYTVVVTPKHSFDEEITARLCTLNVAYIGMIGSKSKVALARKRFTEEFHLSPNQINRIDMPIGIPFAVETPEEIALSIVSRLVDVKNQKLRNVKN
jgi:xanthine dehydrogenase accessory factor